MDDAAKPVGLDSEVKPIEPDPIAAKPMEAAPAEAATAPAPTAKPAPQTDLAVTPRDSLLSSTPAPARRLRMVVNRHLRSGIMGGKRFEVSARIESAQDLHALFKGYPDELVLAYKSVFSDKSHALKRSELLKGARLNPGSLNEIIELEERLAGAFDQLRRMVDILETGDRDVVTEG